MAAFPLFFLYGVFVSFLLIYFLSLLSFSLSFFFFRCLEWHHFSGDSGRFWLVFGLYLDEKLNGPIIMNIQDPKLASRRKKQKRSITIDTKINHPGHSVLCYT